MESLVPHVPPLGSSVKLICDLCYCPRTHIDCFSLTPQTCSWNCTPQETDDGETCRTYDGLGAYGISDKHQHVVERLHAKALWQQALFVVPQDNHKSLSARSVWANRRNNKPAKSNNQGKSTVGISHGR
eukprot:1437628-Amphidinium_carterae.1